MRDLGFVSSSILAAAALLTATTLAGAQSTTTTDRQSSTTTNTTESTKDKIKDTAESTKDKLKEKGHQAADKARELKDKMKDKMEGHSAPVDRAQNGDRVRAVQQALRDKGYDPGPIDGIQGPQTTAALKAYQRTEGLEATGQADTRTVSRLNAAGTTTAPDTSSSPTAPSTPSTTRKQTP